MTKRITITPTDKSSQNHPLIKAIDYLFGIHKGRRGRKQYFIHSILMTALTIAAVGFLIAPQAMSLISALEQNPTQLSTIDTINITDFISPPLLFFIAFVIFSTLTSTAKRLRDINITGWASLALLIPYLGLGFQLYLFFKQGTPGNNKFGPKID